MEIDLMVGAHRDGKCVSHDPSLAWSYYHLMHFTLVSVQRFKALHDCLAIPLWFLINSGTLKECKARFHQAPLPFFAQELNILS